MAPRDGASPAPAPEAEARARRALALVGLLALTLYAARAAPQDPARAPALRRSLSGDGARSCVPVVGVPAFRGAALLRRGARSAAEIACKLVIVQNGGDDAEVRAAVDELESELGAEVVRFPKNMGVAAAWNAILKSSGDAPYFLVMNSDVAFREESMDELVSELQVRLGSGRGADALLMFGFDTPHGVEHGFVAFAIARQAIEVAGLFDENIFPAYFEDDEYVHRLGLAGLGVGRVGADTVVHGEEGAHEYSSGTMKATKDGDTFRDMSRRAANNLYVARKWGLGLDPSTGRLQAAHAHAERGDAGDLAAPAAPYAAPWNDGSRGLGEWDLDPGRRRFIETGEKAGMYVHLLRSRRECSRRPPQVVLLGMHHTGSSLLSGLLQGAGVYTGNEFLVTGGSPNGSQLNPKGYFEDSQLYALNEALLHERGWSWHDFCGFDFEDVIAEDAAPQGWRSLLARFAAHSPFSMKDPRLCVTFAAVRHLFDNPACVILTRSPLQVRRSASHWTPNVAKGVDSLAMNDLYVRSSLEACADLPTFHVDHADLMSDPRAAVDALLADMNAQLCRVEADGPQEPFFGKVDEEAYGALWEPRLNLHKPLEEDERKMDALPLRTRLLYDALRRGDAHHWSREELSEKIPPIGPRDVCAGEGGG